MYYNNVTVKFITGDTYTGKKNDPLSLKLFTYCVVSSIKPKNSGNNQTQVTLTPKPTVVTQKDSVKVIGSGKSVQDKADFLKCSDEDVVAWCIYGEASSEKGQNAVTWVIMNRCDSRYGGDITRYDDVVNIRSDKCFEENLIVL